MKNDKFCFNKSIGVMVAIFIILSTTAFILSQLPKNQTTTNTRAEAPSIIGGVANGQSCYEYNNSSHCAQDCNKTHGILYKCSGTSSLTCCPRTDKFMVDIKIRNNFPRGAEIKTNRVVRGDYFVSFDSNVGVYLKKIGGEVKKTSIYCDKYNTKTQSSFSGATVQDGFATTCNYSFTSDQQEKKFTPYYELTYVVDGIEKTEFFSREIVAYLESQPTASTQQSDVIIPCSESKSCTQQKVCVKTTDVQYPTQCLESCNIYFKSKNTNINLNSVEVNQLVNLGIGTNASWGFIDFEISCDTASNKQPVQLRKYISNPSTDESFTCSYSTPGIYKAVLKGRLTQGNTIGLGKSETIQITVVEKSK